MAVPPEPDDDAVSEGAPDTSLAALLSAYEQQRSRLLVAAQLRPTLDELARSRLPHSRTRALLALCAGLARCTASEEQCLAAQHLLSSPALPLDLLSLALASLGAEEGDDPPDEPQAAAASLLLRALWLLHPPSRAAAGENGAVELLLARCEAAAAGGEAKRGACEALEALLAECEWNQSEFTRLRGASTLLRGGGCAHARALVHSLLTRGVLLPEAARSAEAEVGVEVASEVMRSSA